VVQGPRSQQQRSAGKSEECGGKGRMSAEVRRLLAKSKAAVEQRAVPEDDRRRIFGFN